MAEAPSDVTMRLRIGDQEIEVTGPRDFVEKKIQEFMTSAAVRPAVQQPSGTPVIQTQGGKAKAPAQFLKEYDHKTDVDRVLLAGFFLEKLRNQENFTASEIRQVIIEAKSPPPKNPNDAINSNIKKGMMMLSGDRDNLKAFVLTTDGEEAVQEMRKV